jgi:hypothetical protein
MVVIWNDSKNPIASNNSPAAAAAAATGMTAVAAAE